MADVKKDATNEAEEARLWEIIRYLATDGKGGIWILGELRARNGSEKFSILKKCTTLQESIFEGLECRVLIIKEGDNLSLTKYGTELLKTFDRLNSEICKMLNQEGVSPKEMARMAEQGFLVNVLAQRALESNNEE